MRPMLSIATAAVFLATAFAVQAGGDPAAGKTKAKACAGCHGATGQGVKPNPKLAGLPEAELDQMMKDYKSGKRPNPVMKSMTSSLSEQDMANLAAYYSSLK